MSQRDALTDASALRTSRLRPVASRFKTKVTSWDAPAGRAKAGGDWCGVVKISDDALGLTIGDVSGHGEPVAGMAALLRTSILQAFEECHDPAQILSMANTRIYVQYNNTIVTAIAAVLDRRRRTLTFSNAGHPPPIIVTSYGSTFLSRSPADFPLGIFPRHQAADYVIALPDKALIALYTDGITEHDRDLIMGEEELAQVCARIFFDAREDQARDIAKSMLCRTRGSDDAAVLAVSILP